MPSSPTIVYTHTDEAPALATFSWLPIVRAFLSRAGIQLESKDISLAGRILAAFDGCMPDGDSYADALAELGELAGQPCANIIKLPNISASVPQLTAAIDELQSKGYSVPNYPVDPQTVAEKDARAKYAKVLGSAVNPVLREGNSDRRVATPVKNHAQSHPHSMGSWSDDSASHVASMSEGDFYDSEVSAIIESADKLKIELSKSSGETRVLKASVSVEAGEIVDASFMSVAKLRQFLGEQIDDAKRSGVLLSLHLKATMMKVSDPIIFGHAVDVYFADVIKKHRDALEQLGIHPSNGMSSLENKIQSLPEPQRQAIRDDIDQTYQERPALAMVDSDRGITNLHVPSDIIIDASMPAAIRAGGKMYGPDGELHDTKAIIPDRSYAGVYQATIDFCKQNGAFDVSKMGTVNNVGLMAKKAEEYGSHDKTFEVPEDGTVRVTRSDGTVVFQHDVQRGDIWRMCQTKEVAVRDWVRLAVERARVTGWPAIFWLDKDRAHDANLIDRVQKYLKDHDTDDLEIRIMSPVEATEHACARAAAGLNTISVTGNVLRDYLTDLFPILELGTSAKMLSIVPLLAGGGLFETGAGGSAPKHVQQFLSEGHLRWDSLGEFLALAVSLEDLGRKKEDPKILRLAECLNEATERFLENDRSPSRKVGELDTRGSHAYMAMYWAEALANQTDDPRLAATFAPIARAMKEREADIIDELNDAQGSEVDLDGYYLPDCEKTAAAMRPSPTLNGLVNQLESAED